MGVLRLRPGVAGLLLLVAGLPAAAAARPLPLEAGAYGGWLFLSPDHALRAMEYVPWGTPQQYPRLDSAFEPGVRVGWHFTREIGAEAEASYVVTGVQPGGTATLVPVRLHLTFELPRWSRAWPTAVVGGDLVNLFGGNYLPGQRLGTVHAPGFHWGLGVRVPLLTTLSARVEARHTLTAAYDAGFPASHFEVLAGVAWTPFAKPDKDGDGVADDSDACPDEEGRRPTGCPDGDADGLADKDDQCPQEAGQAPTGCVDADTDGVPDRTDECKGEPGPAPAGCPDRDGDGLPDAKDECPDEKGAAPTGCADRDGDGVPDKLDACPDELGFPPGGCPDGDADGVPDRSDQCPAQKGPAPAGCPDGDGDGVFDAADRCPAERGDKAAFGCVVRDTDKDGVNDALDNCPAEAGAKENFGCASAQLVALRADRLELLAPFAWGKKPAQLDAKKSQPLVDAAAKVLLAHPEIAKVRVEGHTDGTGDAAANLKLSRDRADAVRAALVKAGVPEARLTAAGLGGTKPLQGNETPAGREANQRIELRFDQP